MATNRADGVIFPGKSSLFAEFNKLAQEESRFVAWGAQLPEQRYCSVGSDTLRGGRRATAHLARLGRRRSPFLGDIEAPVLRQRYQGSVHALDEAGLPVERSEK